MKFVKFPVSEVDKIDYRPVKDFNEYLFAIHCMANIAELLGAGKNKIEINEIHELRIKCEDCPAFKPISGEYEYAVVWDNGNIFSYRVNQAGSQFSTAYMTFEMIGEHEARTVEHVGDGAVVAFFDSPRDMAVFIIDKML